MITRADLLTMFPEAADFREDDTETFIDAANLGLPDSRFPAGAASADRARANYVMHNLTKPPLNLAAPHVAAMMGSPRPSVKKPHPWAGTSFGEAVIRATTPPRSPRAARR